MLDEDIHLCLEYLQCKSIECLYLRSTTLSLFYTYIDIITEIITYDRRSAVSDKLVHDRVHVINRKVTIPVKPSLATPVTVPVSYKEKPPKAIVGSKHANIESTDPEFIPMEVGTIRRKVCHNVDKKCILKVYNDQCKAKGISGALTANQKGELRISSYKQNLPNNHLLVSNCGMKPSLAKQYRVLDLGLHDVIVIIVKDFERFLFEDDIRTIACLSKRYSTMVTQVLKLRKRDIVSLLDTRYNYESQKEISSERVELATAALIQFDMNPGKLIRYLGKEFTGESRDVDAFRRVVEPHCDPEDVQQALRILNDGCPSILHWEEPSANKFKLLQRGNQKTFDENVEIADKTLNKEDKHSHLVPCEDWVVYFSPYCRHTSQGMVVKEGKNPRVVWDASTKRCPHDIVLNEVTSLEFEALITFGTAKMEMYELVYNMRISFPHLEIFLAVADVKACFRFARIHADLTGCFGFSANSMYCLATSMVFGSNTSATSWEPFRRIIQSMTKVFFNDASLVGKHEKYLNMLLWPDSEPSKDEFVKAVRCKHNPGVLDATGKLESVELPMYVDDALVACAGKQNMRRMLAAVIEAFFVVCGEPDDAVRQCALAMDKWKGMLVSSTQTFLGLEIDSRKLTVSMTQGYLDEVRELIDTKWKPPKKGTLWYFDVIDMQKLIGKLARLGEGATWIYKIMSHLYSSLAFALSSNKDLLPGLSPEYKEIMFQIHTKKYRALKNSTLAKEINFAIKQAAQMVHRSRLKYPVNASMAAELEFITQALRPDSGISFSTHLAHIIKRMPLAKMYGDSSLKACGGYCIFLEYWWHVDFSEEIKQRTLLYCKNGDDKKFVSINVLEYITVIINYCAAWTAINEGNYTDDPHPIILSVTDNTSALNWTLHTAKSSLIGRALARFFCGIMMGSSVGINSEWISTHDNEIADQISRIKKEKELTSTNFSYNYSKLQQNFQELKTCRFFQPSHLLLSLIRQIVLTRECPDLSQVMQLQPPHLGKLYSSSAYAKGITL